MLKLNLPVTSCKFISSPPICSFAMLIRQLPVIFSLHYSYGLITTLLIYTDFLFDDFKIARVLKARTKTQSGVEWSTDGEISPFRRGVKANIGVKYLNSNGLSLENLSASADGRYIAEGSLVAGDDLKLVVRADNGSHEPGKLFYSSAKLGFEYRVPQLAFSSNIDIVNGPIVQYDVLWTRNHFYVGAEGRWNSKHSRNRSLLKCLEMNIGARYDGPDWMSYVKSTNRFSSLQFAYLHYVSPVLSLGGMVDFKFKGNIQNVIFGTKFM